MIWNLITIGGGAAGFFGAITHAEMGGGSTLILERTSQVLGKVKISGGGRCNVTHDCQEPKAFSAHYPRGEKALIGPLHRWGATETIAWFEAHGVALKTEADGRMFPVTNDSQTIMDCLQDAADDAQVEVRRRCEVTAIRLDSGVFTFVLSDGEVLRARNVLLATGGTRAVSGARLAESLGHALVPPVPSLFTFKVPDPRLKDLAGVSVDRVDCAIEGTDAVGRVGVVRFPEAAAARSNNCCRLFRARRSLPRNCDDCPRLPAAGGGAAFASEPNMHRAIVSALAD